jgi:tetratricopeptide (TPR) repeat protein
MRVKGFAIAAFISLLAAPAPGQSSYESDVAAGMKAYSAGNFSEAERAFKRALKDVEAVSPTDARVGQVLVNLATVKMAQGAEKEVEPLLKRAIGVLELSLGPDHPDLASAYDNLGTFYYDQLLAKAGKTRADVRFAYTALSAGNPGMVGRGSLSRPGGGAGSTTTDQLVQAHQRAAKEDPEVQFFSKSEENLKKALAIRENYFGPASAEIVMSLKDLGELYVVTRRVEQAESVLRRALAIRESLGGVEDAAAAALLNMLASLHRNNKNYTDAEPLYQRALAIQEKLLGPAHADLVPTLQAYALLLKETGRKDESKKFEARAKDIQKKNPS